MYFSNKPYPVVRVEGRNKDYAKLLLNDYAGSVSEDTAIHQYFYQALIINDEKIKNDFLHIAEVEMHHLNILGKIIELLGIKPLFGVVNDSTLTPWNAEYVDYTVKFKDILILNIKQERDAIINYKRHIEEIDDKYIKESLNRIIEDEILHIKYFYSLLKKESNYK